MVSAIKQYSLPARAGVGRKSFISVFPKTRLPTLIIAILARNYSGTTF